MGSLLGGAGMQAGRAEPIQELPGVYTLVQLLRTLYMPPCRQRWDLFVDLGCGSAPPRVACVGSQRPGSPPLAWWRTR